MKPMHSILLVLTVAAFGVPASAAPAPEVVQEGPVTVTKVQSPKKELRMEVLVPGTRDAVWQAFTTTEGLNSWLWKDCAVDLRKGGSWIVNFPGGKTGGGTIEKFKRGSEIRMHAMAPEQFPTVRSVGTTAVFQFQAVGDTATMVRLVQTGWQKGEEWDNAYAYLAKGNAQLLAQLKGRFVNGPMNWEAAAGH